MCGINYALAVMPGITSSLSQMKVWRCGGWCQGTVGHLRQCGVPDYPFSNDANGSLPGSSSGSISYTVLWLMQLRRVFMPATARALCAWGFKGFPSLVPDCAGGRHAGAARAARHQEGEEPAGVPAACDLVPAGGPPSWASAMRVLNSSVDGLGHVPHMASAKAITWCACW